MKGLTDGQLVSEFWAHSTLRSWMDCEEGSWETMCCRAVATHSSSTSGHWFGDVCKKKSELAPYLETSLVENWQTLAVSSAESSSLTHSSDSISQIQIWSLVYSWSAKLLASGQQSTKQWLASQWLCPLCIRPIQSENPPKLNYGV